MGVRGSSSVKYWETPKSAILARPSPPISTFCGGGRVFVLVFVLRESRRKLNIGRRERGASNAREKKRKPKSRDLFSTSAKKNGTQVLHVFFAGRVAGALRGFSFLGCIMNTRKTKPKDTRCASPIVPPWAPPSRLEGSNFNVLVLSASKTTARKKASHQGSTCLLLHIYTHSPLCRWRLGEEGGVMSAGRFSPVGSVGTFFFSACRVRVCVCARVWLGLPQA